MAKTVCKLLGVVFLLVGIAGFVAPGLCWARTSVCAITWFTSSPAQLPCIFGFAGSLTAPPKTFCLVFGVVYLLLGVVGFRLGYLGAPAEDADMAQDPRLRKVLPGTLELGQSGSHQFTSCWELFS